jgi:hypothetical protein
MTSMVHHTNLLTYYKWSKKLYVSMITSICSNFSPVSPFLTINTAFERGDLPLSSSIYNTTYHYVHTLYVQPVEVRKRLCNNRGHPRFFTGTYYPWITNEALCYCWYSTRPLSFEVRGHSLLTNTLHPCLAVAIVCRAAASHLHLSLACTSGKRIQNGCLPKLV